MYTIRNFLPWLVQDTQKGTQEEAVTRMKCVLLIRNNVLIIQFWSRAGGHNGLLVREATHHVTAPTAYK